MRNNKLLRHWHLIALMRNGGRSLDALAAEAGVTTRTIRRDLAVLEESYVPIEKTEDGLWKLLTGAPCPVCAHGNRGTIARR